MRNEVENERRKSTVDQNKLKKLEQVIADKERKLEDAQEAFLRRDSDIRRLEKAIEDERRKSMLDEQRLRQLEKELESKVDEAGANYEKYIAAQEHYELSSDEIERLRQELERARRTKAKLKKPKPTSASTHPEFSPGKEGSSSICRATDMRSLTQRGKAESYS